MMRSKSRVLYDERLKTTAKVKRMSESLILQKHIRMAISENTTGAMVRIVLPRISLLVIEGFLICSE